MTGTELRLFRNRENSCYIEWDLKGINNIFDDLWRTKCRPIFHKPYIQIIIFIGVIL